MESEEGRNAQAGVDVCVARIAAAIGEPARARMLYSLLDGHARTSTELAMVAEVSPSTASVHLHRLKQEGLVNVLVQGKHRYYSLEGPSVARALEGLSILAGESAPRFSPTTPHRLRAARTCYDHIAGTLGVSVHDRLQALSWIGRGPASHPGDYGLTPTGEQALQAMGVDVHAARAARRRFAYPCLDWSERRPHLGGALGAAFLQTALRRRWVSQDLDSRALRLTASGRRELEGRLGLPCEGAG